MVYKPSRLERVFGDDLRHIRVVGRRILAVLIGLIPLKAWRLAVRDALDEWMIRINRDKIEYFIDNYPEVRSPEETVRRIAAGASWVRLNDGEYNLLIGLDKRAYQKLNAALVQRLREILKAEHDNILIGISIIDDYDNLRSLWKKFIVRKGNRTLKLFDSQRTYYSGLISRLLFEKGEAFDRNIALIKSMWEGKKVLFVVGKNSRFFFVEELFDNVATHEFLYAPAKDAFLHYESILDDVRAYPKDWMVIISLGPTATVLAYDLALEGYQALDFGQIPSVYHKAKYGVKYPDGHVMKKELERKQKAVFK